MILKKNTTISQTFEGNKTTGLDVRWNSSSSEGGLNQQGNTRRPAYIGLAHELAHADDYRQDGKVDMNEWYPAENGKKVPLADIYASHIENQIRAENNVPLRVYYSQNINPQARLISGANTSIHMTQQVNMGVIKAANGRQSHSLTMIIPYVYK